MAIHTPTSAMGLLSWSRANPICAMTITISPANVSNSEPILSDNAPLSGATMTITIGNNIIKNPAWEGERFKMLCV
ncbi:hypothetical protein D3C81_1948570 [compost metagenome]